MPPLNHSVPFADVAMNGPRKQCRSCNAWLPVALFYRNGDGHRSRCKSCEKVIRDTAVSADVIAAPGGPLNFRDTPHGEAECTTCHKLIPVDETGNLEEHFAIIMNSLGMQQRYGVKACQKYES